jgi:peptide deformylase
MQLVPSDHPALRQVSEPVMNFDEELAQTVRDMKRLMGLGLAAPQVGINKRIIVVKSWSFGSVMAMINPVILSASGSQTGRESCLSLPGLSRSVERAYEITVEYHTLAGETKSITCSGMAARVIQHEIDHLDGVLIIDRSDR